MRGFGLELPDEARQPPAMALPKINLKAEVPHEIKTELAQTQWGKVLSLTPVVLTVISTLLAGLSSSEMTRAQYDRALAAQRQSKAGDQWSFFQAKKLRGAMQRSALDVLRGTTEVSELDAAALAVFRDAPKPADPAAKFSPSVRAALDAQENSRPDAEMATLLGKTSEAELDTALRVAQDAAIAFDAAQKPLAAAIDEREHESSEGSSTAARRRAVTAARLDYLARRYDAEARLNQTIAGLLELQVRASNLSADRHHRRSGRFFYGMLAGQVGVIVATLALAMQRRNLLWAIAACAGTIALGFAAYVLVAL